MIVAIREALNEMEKNATRKDKIVILTDSLAASISLKNHHKQQARQDLTEEITKKIHILRQRKEITTQICWIPAHCGIEGNEKADQEAKEGLDSETKLNTGLRKKEIYSIIKRHKMEEWQKKMVRQQKRQKFHAIVPKIGKNKINFKIDNNKINRARLGAPTIEKMGKPCEYCQTSPYNIEQTMTSVSAGHFILTPTQPVGSGRPQLGSNPGPPHRKSRALPTEFTAPPAFYILLIFMEINLTTFILFDMR